MRGPGHQAKGEEALKTSRERGEDNDGLKGVTGDETGNQGEEEPIYFFPRL